MTEKTSIDEIDVKILKTLMKNPRTEFSEIARSCEMSINTIRTRFSRLEEIGVITGAIIQINPKSLGNNCNGVIQIQTDFHEGEQFLEFLNRIPSLVTYFKQIGKYNFSTIFSLPNYSDLDEVVQTIKLNPHVLSLDVSVWLDIANLDHPENLQFEPTDGSFSADNSLTSNHKTKEDTSRKLTDQLSPEAQPNSAPNFDDTDIAILNIMSNNARMSFRKVATKTGISPNKVIERYNKLKKHMPFSSLTLNFEKLGYTGIAVFMIRVSNSHVVSNVFNEILKIPNVILGFRTIGSFQISAGIPIRDLDQLFKSYSAISSIPGITGIDLMIHKPYCSWPVNAFFPLVSQNTKHTIVM